MTDAPALVDTWQQGFIHHMNSSFYGMPMIHQLLFSTFGGSYGFLMDIRLMGQNSVLGS